MTGGVQRTVDIEQRSIILSRVSGRRSPERTENKEPKEGRKESLTADGMVCKPSVCGTLKVIVGGGRGEGGGKESAGINDR